jgi:pectate lyase
MKSLVVFVATMLVGAISLYAQPDFSLVGFAEGVTGGSGGKTVQAKSGSEFKSYCESSEKMIIEVSGKISSASASIASNKTIVGIGSTAEITGSTMSMTSGSNIIFRNITIHEAPKGGDIFTILGGKNIWIDHCEIFSKKGDLNGDGKIDAKGDISGGDVDWYDGLIDMTESSQSITISWCVIHDSFKAMLVGKSDSDLLDRKITFHHNHFFNLRERGPSYRGGQGHVFNNYYSDIEYSGVNSRMDATLRVEGNVFEKTGSGEADSKTKITYGPIGAYYSSTLGKYDLKDNTFTDCKGNQPTESTCSYTPPYQYSKVLEPASTTKATVLAYAGVGKLDGTGVNRKELNRISKISSCNNSIVALYNCLGMQVSQSSANAFRQANSIHIVKSSNGARLDVSTIR